MKDQIIALSEQDKRHGDECELYHRNCAEMLLIAADNIYKLGIDSSHVNMITPFGGGMQAERTCGALAGALAVIGLLHAEPKPTENHTMKECTARMVTLFGEAFGSLDCAEIKAAHRSETEGCLPVKLKTGGILEQVLKEAESL